MSANRPCKVAVSSRTRISLPRARARSRQAARTGANPCASHSRFHRSNDPTTAANAAADFRFKQDAGNLAAADQNVVRPFAAGLREGWRELTQGIGDREPGDKTERRRLARRAFRPGQDRHIEIAGGRGPCATMTPAPGALLERPDDGSVFAAGQRQRLGLVVGAADARPGEKPVTRGQGRRRGRHFTNNDRAAVCAASITGPGSTKKNSVTNAVTTSTPFNSPASGASNAAAGSSKYMTLTMRK